MGAGYQAAQATGRRNLWGKSLFFLELRGILDAEDQGALLNVAEYSNPRSPDGAVAAEARVRAAVRGSLRTASRSSMPAPWRGSGGSVRHSHCSRSETVWACCIRGNRQLALSHQGFRDGTW